MVFFGLKRFVGYSLPVTWCIQCMRLRGDDTRKKGSCSLLTRTSWMSSAQVRKNQQTILCWWAEVYLCGLLQCGQVFLWPDPVLACVWSRLLPDHHCLQPRPESGALFWVLLCALSAQGGQMPPYGRYKAIRDMLHRHWLTIATRPS